MPAEAAAMWRSLDGIRKAKRLLTAEERALAHTALDRLLDCDLTTTLWLLTRSRVAFEDQQVPQ